MGRRLRIINYGSKVATILYMFHVFDAGENLIYYAIRLNTLSMLTVVRQRITGAAQIILVKNLSMQTQEWRNWQDAIVSKAVGFKP